MGKPNNKAVVIKKRRAERVALLFLFLALALASLFILFAPYHRLIDFEKKFDTLCIAFGTFGTVVSILFIAYFFYFIVAKHTALIVTEEGIYDFVTGNKGVGFIEKGKITSIRIFGTKRKPILGIQVDNPKHLIKTVKKSVQDVVLYNLDMNRPAIVIRQSDLSVPISDAAKLICQKLNSTGGVSVDETHTAIEKIYAETRQFANDKETKQFAPNKTQSTEIPVNIPEVSYAEEAKLPKYIFPIEKATKPGPQGEEDPSPEPYFELRRKEA